MDNRFSKNKDKADVRIDWLEEEIRFKYGVVLNKLSAMVEDSHDIIALGNSKSFARMVPFRVSSIQDDPQFAKAISGELTKAIQRLLFKYNLETDQIGSCVYRSIKTPIVLIQEDGDVVELTTKEVILSNKDYDRRDISKLQMEIEKYRQEKGRLVVLRPDNLGYKEFILF